VAATTVFAPLVGVAAVGTVAISVRERRTGKREEGAVKWLRARTTLRRDALWLQFHDEYARRECRVWRVIYEMSQLSRGVWLGGTLYTSR
jgi:hypothetical protein